jgi:hypothetical protein
MDEPIADDRQVEKFLNGGDIPPGLRAPVLVAREMWRKCWPGMELDGSADLIVMALDRMGYIRTRPRRQPSARSTSDDQKRRNRHATGEQSR